MRLALEMVREEEDEEPLSPREEEVLRLLAQGLSHKEVAEALAISEKTVATYRERGMEKLGLKSRSELLRYAVKRGWLRG
ncbi:MAG: response regulator transcription factor [Thermus sp.]